MAYYIKQQFISMNRPKEKFINLKGITIHSTANIGATSLNHYNYWNNADRQSSVHYIADWIGEEIYQFIPESEIAWHTGNWQGNREWLGIEMAETSDKNQFDIVWNKTVWFVADLCIKHNWNVDDNVWSHNGLRSLYKGIDHTDPYEYLTRMGKTWNQLCDVINAKIIELKKPTPIITPSRSTISTTQSINNNQGDDNVLETCVLLFSKDDYFAGGDIAQKYNCAIFIRPTDKTCPKEAFNSKKLFVIGGSSVKHPNEILLSGLTKFDTCTAVGNYIKGK